MRISVVEQNHYQGQVFGNDAYLDWKAMNFNQKMIEEIEVLMTDKSAISGFVKAYV